MRHIIRLASIAIYLTIAIDAYTQSPQQRRIYEWISSWTNTKVIGTNPHPSNLSITDFLKEATIIPIYKVRCVKGAFALQENKEGRLISFRQNVYVYIYGRMYQLAENRPEIATLQGSLKKKQPFEVCYLTIDFATYGYNVPLLFTDKKLSFIIDKATQHDNVISYIEKRYGSFDRYLEQSVLDDKRDSMQAGESDIKNVLLTNYKYYEKTCARDTAFIIGKLIEQLQLACGDITDNQKVLLVSRLRSRIDPFTAALVKMQINDTAVTRRTLADRNEAIVAKEKLTTMTGPYDFLLLNTPIASELLYILSKKQFEKYRDFIDLWFPFQDSGLNDNLKTDRYSFIQTLLERKAIIPWNGFKEFGEYLAKIYKGSGCRN